MMGNWARANEPPVGSAWAGKRSPPQMDQAATAVTMVANPRGVGVRIGFYCWVEVWRRTEEGILDASALVYEMQVGDW